MDKNIEILFDLIAKGASVDTLLNEGFRVLGNPLLILDISLAFVTHAGNDVITDEPVWEWILEKGYVTEEYVKSVMGAEQGNEGYTPFTTSMTEVIWQNALLHHRQAVIRLINNGEPVAYLKLLEYNKPITKEDEKYFIMLGRFVAIAFGSHENAPKLHFKEPVIESFFASLLTRRLTDEETITQRQLSFNIVLDKYLHVICVEFSPTIINNSDKIFHIKNRIKNYFNKDVAMLYENRLVILYDSFKEDPFDENMLTKLEEFSATYGIRFGISMSFDKLYKFYEYYNQAAETFNIANKSLDKNSVLRYEKLIVTHMILEFQEHGKLMNLVHPKIRKLAESDNKKDSLLLQTLFAYINCSQDITTASALLNVHYNTLKYRLKKLEQITGFDFTKPDVLFSILLSERVLKIINLPL